jgi:hypothetical protein
MEWSGNGNVCFQDGSKNKILDNVGSPQSEVKPAFAFFPTPPYLSLTTIFNIIPVNNDKHNVSHYHDFRNIPESGCIFLLWGAEDQGGLFSRNS